MRENEQLPKQDSGLSSRPLIGYTGGHQENAERFTPERRADAIIHVLYDNTSIPKCGELRDTIAAEIREAVELEREKCAQICEDVVTFSEEHINYAPENTNQEKCGWCDGLEKAARIIRKSK